MSNPVKDPANPASFGRCRSGSGSGSGQIIAIRFRPEFPFRSHTESELDGLMSIDKISIKGKVKNFTRLRKQVKVNDKSVAVVPLKCFNRIALVADRETTIEECLCRSGSGSGQIIAIRFRPEFPFRSHTESELDGLMSIDKISIKGKAKNFTQLRKQVKVNDKSVAVVPLKCFNRIALVADRETTIEECLQ